jgi:nitrite reductase/ring-hydroxylating ferredoxin subunit
MKFNSVTSLETLLETPLPRRDALKVIGCTLCSLALAKVSFAQDTVTATQVMNSAELVQAGDYTLVTVDEKSAIVYAASEQVENSLEWRGVWLVAFTRYCTHRGAKLEVPLDGIMHCPRHGQDFEASTGVPVGEKDKTRKPLLQYALETRADGTVWISGVARSVS